MTLYRGDDAKDFISITLDNIADKTLTKAIFQCETIKKVFENPTFPIKITFTRAETQKLQIGNQCYMAVYYLDDDNITELKQTCNGVLEFNTQSGVVG